MHTLAAVFLLSAGAPLISAPAPKGQEQRRPPNTVNGQRVPKQHPQQPNFQQVREDEIPPGTPIQTLREGDVLDLTKAAKREAERKYAPAVERMFDAVMTNDPSAGCAAHRFFLWRGENDIHL